MLSWSKTLSGSAEGEGVVGGVGVELGGVEAERLGDLCRVEAVDGLAETPDRRMQLLSHVPRGVDLQQALRLEDRLGVVGALRN